jgi:hypothetical protein
MDLIKNNIKHPIKCVESLSIEWYYLYYIIFLFRLAHKIDTFDKVSDFD